MASGGIEFRTNTLDAMDDEVGTLVVPGGSGATAAARDRKLADALCRARQNGARIYCCCSGALIVAAALGLRDGRIAIHARKRADLRALFGGEVVSGIAESDGIVSIGGRRSHSVKSVRLAFRILEDLDPGLPRSISERTEIAWRPA